VICPYHHVQLTWGWLRATRIWGGSNLPSQRSRERARCDDSRTMHTTAGNMSPSTQGCETSLKRDSSHFLSLCGLETEDSSDATLTAVAERRVATYHARTMLQCDSAQARENARATRINQNIHKWRWRCGVCRAVGSPLEGGQPTRRGRAGRPNLLFPRIVIVPIRPQNAHVYVRRGREGQRGRV
jgi:hypothetical protein